MFYNRVCAGTPQASAAFPIVPVTIPLVLHGDAVPCVAVARAASSSAQTWSVSSLLTTGPTLLTNHVLSMLFSGTSNADTIHKLLLYLGWSFYFLQRGIHPTCDPYKKKFPAGSTESRLAGPVGGESFIPCVTGYVPSCFPCSIFPF